MTRTPPPARGITAPALLAGAGFGAFFDGIVFHQLLQWHHFTESYRSADDLAGLEYNTFWDGLFHIASWLLLGAAVLWLWQRRGSARDAVPRTLVGLLLIGWGVFNIVDEVVLHVLLQAHHIRMVPNYLWYDLAYTAAGLLLIAVGMLVKRRS